MPSEQMRIQRQTDPTAITATSVSSGWIVGSWQSAEGRLTRSSSVPRKPYQDGQDRHNSHDQEHLAPLPRRTRQPPLEAVRGEHAACEGDG